MPVLRPAQREEAATGAAISAAIGTGLLPDLSATAKWLSFES
jgi:glycerol kinase